LFDLLKGVADLKNFSTSELSYEEKLRKSCALFGFHPTDYQWKLLADRSKRIVVKWARQSGKTTTLAMKAILFALMNPKTLVLIVSPSLRQSMIMRDRVGDILSSLPAIFKQMLITKMQRTVITFRNGSRIIALPNSPPLLRGYTAHMIIADEAAFFRDDEMVFYSVMMPMMATTNGTLIVSSTPWGKNSVFYKFCLSPEFSKHENTWRDAVQAGLTTESFIEEMRNSLPQERFLREFEAQFVEDVDSWLPQDLITRCVDGNLEYLEFGVEAKGEFFAGVDFGKHQDHSVVTVLERKEKTFKVVHVKRFPLETPYASVIGYIKALCDKWRSIYRISADITGVGEYIVEDMMRGGIGNVTGVNFTAPTKEALATMMKQEMVKGCLFFPYDRELINELNIEKFEMMKTGGIKFSHPEGSHDDMFWSLALAVHAARGEEKPTWVVTGATPK